MNPDPVAIIRSGLELFNRAEYDESISALPPQIEWDTSEAVPDGRLYRGRDEVVALWREIGERWDDFRIEPDRWIETEGAVLMLGRLIARGAGSGVPVDSPWDQVWRIEDSVPVRCENYSDRAQAWRAADLEPGS